MMSNEVPKATHYSTSSIRHSLYSCTQIPSFPFMLFSLSASFSCQTRYIFLPFCSLTQTLTVSLCLTAAKSTPLASYASPLSPAVPSQILYSACTYHLFSVVLLLPAPLGPSPRLHTATQSSVRAGVCKEKKSHYIGNENHRTFFSQRKLSDLHAVLHPPPLLSCFKPGTLAAFELHMKNHEVFVISLQLYLYSIVFFFKGSVNDLNSF